MINLAKLSIFRPEPIDRTPEEDDLSMLTIADLALASAILREYMVDPTIPAPLYVRQLFAINRELLSRADRLNEMIDELASEIDVADETIAGARLLAEGRY